MANMIFTGFFDEYAVSFEEQLRGMAELGIGYTELRTVNGKNVSLLEGEELKQIKALLDSYGFGVSSIGSPLGKIALDGDFEEHLRVAKRVFETANYLGAKYVRMFSFYPPEGRSITDCEEEVREKLSALLALAREYGVTLCHENEARIYGDIPERCRKVLDWFGGEMRCVFDMGNFVLEGVKPYPSAYELLKSDIAYFHIKDARPDGAIGPPGEGEGAIAEILKDYAESATEDFFISLEPHLQLISEKDAGVTRRFTNPFVYPDPKTAFTDAANRLKALVK